MDLDNEMTVKTVPKEISDQVKRARATAEKSQDQLAKICEVRVAAIRDIENMEGEYNAGLVLKIEKALKVKFTRSWNKDKK